VTDGSDVYAPPAASAPAPPESRAQVAFSRFAWVVLGYILLVILFGAWVRITGSGAGCGEHWPTCHGEVVPRSPTVKTIIEYTHRLTSGILGPLAIGMVVWAFRGAGRRPLVKCCAAVTLALIVVEALIGAGLVKNQLVAEDDSVARAWAVGLHLGNTLLLTAAAALTAWFGAGRELPRLAAHFPWRRALIAGLFGIMLVSMTGAVTALGDTLFPVRPTQGVGVFARVREDLGAGTHFLVQLRLLHPVIAVLIGGGLLWVAGRICAWLEQTPGSDTHGALRLGRALQLLLFVQLVAGAINIALGAPGWMQLLHLLLAQGVWLTAVLLYVAASSTASHT
jgi:heme A synthase